MAHADIRVAGFGDASAGSPLQMALHPRLTQKLESPSQPAAWAESGLTCSSLHGTNPAH